MFPTIKAGFLATTMAAAALAPAAGIATFASVEAAYAKGGGNGNGGGGGGGDRGNNGGGHGSEARGGDKSDRGGDRSVRGAGRPDWAGSQRSGGGGGRSDSARGSSDPISNFIRGLTGQEKREARAQARQGTSAARQAPTVHAPQRSVAPASRPSRPTDLHPSELGNMNAVLAHIRNGNTSGPVGQMAALAVASAAADEAFAALAPDDVAAYGGLQDALEDAKFDSLADYIAARDAENGEKIVEIETALAGIPTFDATSYADYLAAREEADAILAPAQDSILAYWNKNPDAQPEIDHELEEPLLDALMSRFDGYEAQIDAAIAEAEAEEDAEPEELDAACEDENGCETPDTHGLDLAATE
jgi:hypothetical protein